MNSLFFNHFFERAFTTKILKALLLLKYLLNQKKWLKKDQQNLEYYYFFNFANLNHNVCCCRIEGKHSDFYRSSLRYRGIYCGHPEKSFLPLKFFLKTRSKLSSQNAIPELMKKQSYYMNFKHKNTYDLFFQKFGVIILI